MKVCRKCNGTSIKSHRNYSHGKKSRPTTTLACKNCGSTDIETKSDYRRNRRQRKQ